jgi:hypothetical protein
VLVPDSGPDTPPRSLRAEYKDQWRETIASSYAVTGDLVRARARLELIGDADSIQALSAQAQRALASGSPFEIAQELARLAADLQVGVSSVPSPPPSPIAAVAPSQKPLPATAHETPPSAVSASPSAGASPRNQPTVFPTPSTIPFSTPVASPSVPLRLVSQDEVCGPNVKAGLLQVTVLDAKGSPLPGVEITVTWGQGADRFFTGLQPEISVGYADYTMKGGTTYSVQVARLGVPISGLTPPICISADKQSYLGGLRLTFAAP